MYNPAGLDASAKPSVQRAARSRSAGTLPAHKREKKIGRSWSGLCFDKAGRPKTTQFRRKRMVNPRRSAVTLLAVLLFAIPFAAQTPVAAPNGKAPGAVAGDVTTDYFGTKANTSRLSLSKSLLSAIVRDSRRPMPFSESPVRRVLHPSRFCSSYFPFCYFVQLPPCTDVSTPAAARILWFQHAPSELEY